MEQERKIISVHIEKTGGTSLESVLIRSFGKDMVLLWVPNKNVFTRTGNVELVRTQTSYEYLRLLIQKTPIIPVIHMFKKYVLDQNFYEAISPDRLPQTQFDVLHGHFVSNQFDNFVPNGFKTVVLREPLERMVSHFKYWVRTHGSPTHRIGLKYDPKFTFEDFCFSPVLQNYQTQALGGEDLERDFGLVGTTNKLDVFLDKLLTIFQVPHESLITPLLKRSPSMDIDPSITCLINDQSFCRQFESFHLADVHNYHIACEMS